MGAGSAGSQTARERPFTNAAEGCPVGSLAAGGAGHFGVGMTEHNDRHTMDRTREHLARADSELETVQHFLDPRSGLEDALDELQRGGQVLLERRLDLLGRKDEPAVLDRVGPQLDSKRRDGVFTVGPVRRVTRR